MAGVEVWTRSLLHSLQVIDLENSYEVFLSAKDLKILKPEFKTFTFTGVSPCAMPPVPNILWHNTVLPWLAKKHSLDLVHIPTIRRIPLIKGCKIVATVHDVAPFRLKEKYDVLRTVYHRHFLNKLVHRADHIIAVSHYTKNELMEFTGYPEEKITVIYPGIRKVFAPQEKGIGKSFFLFVSRIEYPAKNHLRLIEAFNLFKQKTGAPHELLFVGADWQGAEIVKKAAASSCFAHEIKFLGFIPIQEMVSLYASCDLMVYPSLYEGFGMPLIEAMACGAPVICSNTSSLKEIGSGKALLFDPYNPEEIAYALEKGLDPEFQATARRQGPAWASTYNWEQCAREVIKVYEETAG